MGMKEFILVRPEVRDRAIEFIQQLPVSGEWEVCIRKTRVSKTRQQLGALFGVWADYIVEQTGYTINEIHTEWKRMFLVRIYCDDPQGSMQDMFVDHLLTLQSKCDWDAMRKHAARISLAWSTVEQMKKYMDRIQQHYIAAGMPLPIPDKYRETYR